MGSLNKFFYAKGVSKRDVLIAADRINGLIDTDDDTLVIQFDGLGNDMDSVQGTITLELDPAGSVKDFVQELFSASAKNPFVVVGDDVDDEGVSGQFKVVSNVTVGDAV